MKSKNVPEQICALCEYSEDIFQGEYCICKKKGVVNPSDSCSRFQLNPLKIKVQVRKIPKFSMPPDPSGKIQK